MPRLWRALVLGPVLFGFATTAHAQGEIDMDDTPQQPQQQPQPPTDQPAEQPDANQPVVKDPKVAKKWLQAADTLVRKGDQLTKQNKPADAKTQYDNAVTAYQKAMEASDDVTITYALAIAEDKAGNAPDAMKHLKALAAAQGMKPDLVKKAQAKLDELSMKVGLVTLQITPDGTQISLAGKVVGEAPMTEPLVLMPGTVTLSLAAVGYQPKDIELKIEAGSESERKIGLEPVPIVTKPVEQEQPETPVVEGPKKPNLMPIYIGGGATITFTIVATITGIMAVGEHSTYVDPMATKQERADAQSSGRTLAHVTDVCLVGAIGAAAFTTYWYLYKIKPQQSAQAERQALNRSKVDVVPWVQPQAGGLVAVGSF